MNGPAHPSAPAPDPMLDELRVIKESISLGHGNDVRRLAETLRKIEAEHPARVIHPPQPRSRLIAG